MSSTGHTRSHTGTIHHQRTRGHHFTPCERLTSFYMLSTLRLSHHIRRGKLAQTWTTPHQRRSPGSRPGQAEASHHSRAESAHQHRRETQAKKRTRTPGTRQKKIKKFSIGSSERIFSLRCLRAQKLARLIEKF